MLSHYKGRPGFKITLISYYTLSSQEESLLQEFIHFTSTSALTLCMSKKLVLFLPTWSSAQVRETDSNQNCITIKSYYVKCHRERSLGL
jgi:hypothetical protein